MKINPAIHMKLITALSRLLAVSLPAQSTSQGDIKLN
jgi:hypothetical protein